MGFPGLLNMKTFVKFFGASLTLGGGYIFLLLSLECFFHYPTRAYLNSLIPAYIFSLFIYILFSLILLLPWSVLVFVLERYVSGKKNEVEPGFLRRRTPALWLAPVTVGFFWLIKTAELQVGPIYYILVFLLMVFLLLAAVKQGRVVLMVSVLTLVAGISLRRYHIHYTSEVSPDPGRPNILLLVSDTTRRDSLSFYGYKRDTTPRLKLLADRSAIFDAAHSTSSWTKPATASLLTGRFLTEDPIHHGPAGLDWSGPTLAQVLRRIGYDTYLLSANSNAASYFGHARGYGFREHSLPPPHMALQRFVVLKFFQKRFQGRTALSLKNMELSLREFALKLKLPQSRLSDFALGRIPAGIKLNQSRTAVYRKLLNKLIARKAAEELRRMPGFLPPRRSLLYIWLSTAYRLSLGYYYFALEDARGEVSEYWIRDREIRDRFIRWIDSGRRPERPFFAHIQIMGPHTPYAPQMPYLLPHFDPGFQPIQITPPTQHTPPSVPAPRLSPLRLHNLKASYDDSLRITDANLGDMLEHLKQRGLLANTIVVYISDHGEAFYEHFIYGHMNSLHRELTEVPFFISWPGKIKQGRYAFPVSITDLYPTLLTLVGEGARLKDTQGRAIFRADGGLNPVPEHFFLQQATLVGGAWKLKRRSHLAFGVHGAVVTEKGKLIFEDEENGQRYYYFPSGDSLEKRDPALIFDENTPKYLQDMRKLLPEGPGK